MLIPLRFFVMIAIAIVALFFGMLSVNFNLQNVYPMRLSDYYFNYSLGYLHRGLIGSLLHLFYGTPRVEMIQTVIPQFNYYLIRVLVMFFWLLLFIPLLRLRLSTSMNCLFIAYISLLLLAPIWRYENNYNHMDIYLLPCALLALICLNRCMPLLMIAPLVIGLLIHPLMLMFIALLYLLVLHACLTNEKYATVYQRWIFSFCTTLTILLLINILNDPSRNIELLELYNYPYSSKFDWLKNDYLHTFNHNSSYILSTWRVHTTIMLLMLCLFVLIPSILFLSLTFELDKEEAFKSNLLSHQLAQLPAFRWMMNFDKQILVLSGMLLFLPTTIVVPDTYRMYLLGFWGVAIVLIYLLWSARIQVNTKKDTSTLQPIRRTFLATCVGLLAYSFGGAPLVVFPDYSPRLHSCKLNCIPMLTDNFLGHFYSDSVFSLFYSQLFPITLDARSLQLHSWKFRNNELNDSLLVIPPGSSGLILSKILPIETGGGELIQISVEYVSDDVPQIELVTEKQYLATPMIATNSLTTWLVDYNSAGVAIVDLLLLQQDALLIKQITIKRIQDKKQYKL